MAKKTKLKKTLVEQILTKADIPHQGLQINALENETGDIDDRSQIYKTLALTGDKTGPVIGILPITEHLSEKKLAKISGNKKVAMIPQKDNWLCSWCQQSSWYPPKALLPYLHRPGCSRTRSYYRIRWRSWT